MEFFIEGKEAPSKTNKSTMLLLKMGLMLRSTSLRDVANHNF